ncbi:MAG: hypothetical protein H7Y30_08615 [Pyrinomonadaceae bacterium]|nr:hypothetical protein [Pyrinomonadaceae bacterium]
MIQYSSVSPTPPQLAELNAKCDSCLAIKKQQFTEELTEAEAKALLHPIELEIDQLVYQLYDLNEDEIAIVEASARR